MTRRLLFVLLAVIAIKAAFFLPDPQPAFFFGDSVAYLATAISNIIPLDRSFTYGFFLKPLVSGHSLLPVLLVQALLSALASWIVAVCLLRYFQAKFWIAAGCAVLCAVEPLQLMSERFIMTETVSTFAFAICMWSAFEFLRSGRIAALLVAELAGVAAMSFRYSFLAVVLALSVCLPLLANPTSKPWHKRARTTATLLLVSVIATQGLLLGYRHWYGHLTHEPPSYLSRDGEFLVADVAPIVKPQDFPVAAKRDVVFGSLRAPLADPLLRRVHRWLPGGLCDAISKSVNGNEDEANRLAKKTAIRAMERDPMGLLKLAAYTYGEFFRPESVHWALELNQGRILIRDSERPYIEDAEKDTQPVSSDVALIRKHFGIDTSHRRFDSLTKRWEGVSVPWCWVLAILPIAYLVSLSFKWRRVQAAEIVCLLVLWILLLEAVIPTEFANPRYLTAEAWLAWIAIGSMISSRKLHL